MADAPQIEFDIHHGLEMNRNPLRRFFRCARDENGESPRMFLSAEPYRNSAERANQKIGGVDPQEEAIMRSMPYANQQFNSAHASMLESIEWDGVVESIERDQFSCKLRVVKGIDVDFDEFALIPMEHVDPRDLDLVLPGAIFRLAAGIELVDGKRQQFLRLIFRRLPTLLQSEIDEEYSHLKQLVDGIEWS